MKQYYYDFHIHSCLSPCGDPDMTPGNIVGMAKLKGLDVIALTDHNTCRNCEAAIRIGEAMGLPVLPGMELCTAEDIHVVCLFRELSGALAFSDYVYFRLPDIPNRPDIFGEQSVMDENDNMLGSEPRLLINAAGISIDDVPALTAQYGGAAFPAHIDKPSNGILGVLGTIPASSGFRTAELSNNCDRQALLRDHAQLCGLRFLRNSDAHYLWQISERENYIRLPGLTADGIIGLIKKQKSAKL